MKRAFLTFSLVGLSACVTTAPAPAPRMPFDEAMRDAAGDPSASSKSKSGSSIEDTHASKSLAAAMRAFSTVGHAQRKRTERGAPMPAEHLAAWNVVLAEVDSFMAVAARHSSVLDTVRTRLQLETEIQTDGSVYGDVPSVLADRVQNTLRALSTKLSAQTATRRRAVTLRFAWPVSPVVVTSPYGDRLHPVHGGYRFHSGTDLAAQADQSVFAAEGGTVMFSGWNGGHGKSVEVQHADGHTSTRYSHLDALMVAVGDRVKRGGLVGLAGQTGVATGVHVHFEVHRDGEAIDPEFVLDEGPGTLASNPSARTSR